MPDNTGLRFTVKAGEHPEDTFSVVDFTLDEALNQPFTLDINLAPARADIPFGGVPDSRCTLKIWYNGELQREIFGMISEFTRGDTGFHRARYRFRVHPDHRTGR